MVRDAVQSSLFIQLLGGDQSGHLKIFGVGPVNKTPCKYSSRAATGVLLNIDHTLTEWPNIDHFLFFQLFLRLLKKSLLIQLKGKLQELCKV